ncbi:MAG: alcohol dehydrogenase catalytic domain-containing protein [Pseudomonadota bacterium]
MAADPLATAAPAAPAAMTAAWFAEGRASLVSLPTPNPAPGQALVRVDYCGICNTDLELLAGYYGFAGVPGHEFVGRVAFAPGRPELTGLRVVGEINIGCGVCARCLGGDARHCAQRKALGIKGWDGALAEYVLLPMANLRRVPEGVADRAAVFAEPLAAALEIGQQVHITNRDKVLVLGDGKLGLLVALGLRHLAPGLILAGRHQAKLDIATAQGVRALLAEREDLTELARGLGGFDLVVEATGRPEGLELALGLVRPEGTIVAKTTSHRPGSLNLAALVVNEINLMGSRCGDLGLALSYLQNRWLAVEPLITAEFPLAELSAALQAARTPGSLKVLVRPA